MEVIRSTGATGAEALASRLQQELAASQQVLWLVSGGSNIAYCVHVMDSLKAELTSRLSVMPVDERYGPEGHDESNWTQLMQAGFTPQRATLLHVLRDQETFQATIRRYERQTARAFAAADRVIAQLGIGTDGHIAGILPDFAAATEPTALVVGYEAPPYQRLTVTFPGIRQVDTAYVFAFGESKREVLTTLCRDNLDPTQQPAQILKQLPEVYLYNDLIG